MSSKSSCILTGRKKEGVPCSFVTHRYVALSDNEKTGYKARELKSVHVDAVGTFVKFVIHKNHVNRHNMYNQVDLWVGFQFWRKSL